MHPIPRLLFLILSLSLFLSHLSYGKSQFTLPPLMEQMTELGDDSQPSSALKPPWCRSGLKSSEQIICSSPLLWPLEEQNVALYHALYNNSKSNQDELYAWLNYRTTQCYSPQSCKQVYLQRIQVLTERKLISQGMDSANLFQYDNNTHQPSWCANKLNRNEAFICQNRPLWRFDHALNTVYKTMTPKQKKTLKMAKWRKQKRAVKCTTSVSDCMQLFHEKILQLHYVPKN